MADKESGAGLNGFDFAHHKKDEGVKICAEIISWLFFPPLVATVFFVFLIFWYSQDLTQGLQWLIYVAPFLIFIPLIFFALSYKLHWISDVDLTKRSERPAFLIVFTVSLAVASMIMYLLHAPEKFVIYIFSGLIMVILASIITFYWKISFHTMVITSVISAIVIIGGLRFWPFFLLIPIIAWARIVLKKHSLYQAIGGSLLSAAITWTVFALFGFRLFY